MAENVGMNQLLCSPEGVEEIRNAPCTAVESFGVFHGSGEVGRDYDIPTAQNLSNGVILYYTPKKDAEDETEKETHHCGLGSLDMLPVSPQVIMSHGGSRGIQAAAFVQFVSGIARNFAVLAFQKDRADSEDQTDKRVAGFNYFFSDANGTVQAMGGRSRGARCATRSCEYNLPRVPLSHKPLRRERERDEHSLTFWRLDSCILCEQKPDPVELPAGSRHGGQEAGATGTPGRRAGPIHQRVERLGKFAFLHLLQEDGTGESGRSPSLLDHIS